jgi:hypothetical protein
VSYYIGNAEGTHNLKTLNTVTSANLRPTCAQSTSAYNTGSATQCTFNVGLSCSASAAMTYFMNHPSLAEACSVQSFPFPP